MRGALVSTLCLGRDARIIPAYAGSTMCLVAVLIFERDHPRVCGEHPCLKEATFFVTRIIPAYAGSTRLPR